MSRDENNRTGGNTISFLRIFLFVILAFILTCCSGGDLIRSRAEHFARSTYPDVDKILYCRVDTITLGDNMNHRIEQAKESVKHAESFLESAERSAERNRRDGFKTLYSSDTARISEYKADVERETARLRALDSLLAATSQEVIDTPAAYQCCIAYNDPSNLVWVQLDPYGNLIQISKDMMQLYINPGEDLPGYLEVNRRFSRY